MNAGPFICRRCSRPCANGTGLAAHERACERGGGTKTTSPKLLATVTAIAPVTERTVGGARVCAKCHDAYPLGGLGEHLRTECRRSATYQLVNA